MTEEESTCLKQDLYDDKLELIELEIDDKISILTPGDETINLESDLMIDVSIQQEHQQEEELEEELENIEDQVELIDANSSDEAFELTGSRNKTKHELAQGYGFNDEQIGIFEDTFQIFDKDCDGFITLIEIRTVMNSLGFYPGDDIIRKSIQDIDNDNSGTVDFEEFICMMSKFRRSTQELDEELKEIFKIFDKNQDGFIDYAELKDVLVRLGENITDDEVMDMIKEADVDGDLKVSYNEFRSILYDNRAR